MKLKVKSFEELSKDKKIPKINSSLLIKDNVYYSLIMSEKKEIEVSNLSNLKNGYYFEGYYWYDWMLQNNYSNLLENE